MTPRTDKSEQEWRSELTPAQYKVLRREGTEPPFSGGYVHTKEDGFTAAPVAAPICSRRTPNSTPVGPRHRSRRVPPHRRRATAVAAEAADAAGSPRLTRGRSAKLGARLPVRCPLDRPSRRTLSSV